MISLYLNSSPSFSQLIVVQIVIHWLRVTHIILNFLTELKHLHHVSASVARDSLGIVAIVQAVLKLPHYRRKVGRKKKTKLKKIMNGKAYQCKISRYFGLNY